MLDNLIFSRYFFQRVSDCKLLDFGVRSDHSAIQVTFKVTPIKFKVNDRIQTSIYYWI